MFSRCVYVGCEARAMEIVSPVLLRMRRFGPSATDRKVSYNFNLGKTVKITFFTLANSYRTKKR